MKPGSQFSLNILTLEIHLKKELTLNTKLLECNILADQNYPGYIMKTSNETGCKTKTYKSEIYSKSRIPLLALMF